MLAHGGHWPDISDEKWAYAQSGSIGQHQGRSLVSMTAVFSLVLSSKLVGKWL